MSVTNYRPHVSRMRVNDPFGGQLSAEVERLRREGAVKITAEKDRGTDTWRIESLKFVKEEG